MMRSVLRIFSGLAMITMIETTTSFDMLVERHCSESVHGRRGRT